MTAALPSASGRPGGGPRLGANAAGVLAARLLVPAANLLLLVTLARALGVEALGRYTLLVTAFGVLESVKSLGLGTLVTREVAAAGASGLAHAAGLVRIGAAGALLAAPVLVLVAALSAGASPALLLAAAVISLGLFPSAVATANDAVFLALGRARVSALAAAAENAFRLAGSVLVVVLAGGDLILLAAVYAAGRGVAAGVGWAVLRRDGLGLGRPGPGCVRRMLARAPEYLAIFALPIALFRLDVFLLSWLQGDEAVGTYAAAMRLVTLVLIVPDSVLTALFALLSRVAGGGDRAELERLVQRAARAIGVAVAPLAVAAMVAAPWIVQLLYGPRFAASAPVLRTLMWAPVLFALSRTLGDGLVAAGKARSVAGVVLAVFAVGVPLYAALIRARGAPGAALGFVLCMALLCALSLVQAVRLRLVCDPAAFLTALAPLAGAAAAWHLAPAPARQALALAACAAAVAVLGAVELRGRCLWRHPGKATPS